MWLVLIIGVGIDGTVDMKLILDGNFDATSSSIDSSDYIEVMSY
jgi:hypothetical protein